MKTLIIICLSIIFPIFPFSHAAKLTALQIMEKQKELQSVDTEFEIQKMILVDKSGTKESRELKRVIKKTGKEVYRSLLVFMGPANIKGTALLTWQNENAADDQWIYLAAQGKMQRIAEGGKKNYFLGTDYTYEDLQSEATEDYNYTLLGEEKCGKKDKFECFKIESSPANAKKRKESSYSKRILWIRKDIFVTSKVEYYSKRKKLIKTQTTYDWQNVSGTVWRAKKALMNNKKNKHKTVIASVKIEVNQEIKDQVFTERYILKSEHIK